uniref:Cationic amino acid transporter 2 n=1 Tax=Cacopsylla melanoneura TaxID=428564 RepID=A0A8D8WU16_9HEMI
MFLFFCSSALCYVEFASRLSVAGSAYNYTYTSVGEFAAFVIGWNLVLEYVIGTASEAKAISNQIDALLGNAYQNAMEARFPMHSSFLSTYPDLIAASIVLVMSALISYGVKESTRINSILTFLNLGTVVTIVLSGSTKLNFANWTIPRQSIPPQYRSTAGNGGFFPFGVSGVMAGAAKCFFGYVGFDAIATTGEEAKNPRRNIPLSIILSLTVVFICYLCISVVLTLVIPYYEQDPEAPFLNIFEVFGWTFMKWLVSVGSLFALLTGMFGALFPLPRILYSMSRDGLLYNSFAYVSPLTHTPIVSSLATGLLTAVLSAIFKLDQLIDMLSIGTLLAYTIVALSVLILRYSEELEQEETSDDDAGRYSDPVLVQSTGLGLNRNNVKFDPTESHGDNSTPIKPSSAPIDHQNGTETNTPHEEFHAISCPSTPPINSEHFETHQHTGYSTTGESNTQTTNACDLNIIQREIIVEAAQLESVGDQVNKRDRPSEQSNVINRTKINNQTKENGHPVYIEVTDECIRPSRGQVSNKYTPGGHYVKHVLNKPAGFTSSGSSLSVRALLNLNSTTRRVTAASQFTSKVCIYVFVGLTIVVCLTLNAVTDVDLNLDSNEIPASGNETLALRVIENQTNELLALNNHTLALPVSLNEKQAILALRVNRTSSSGRLPNYELNSSSQAVSNSSPVRFLDNYKTIRYENHPDSTASSSFPPSYSSSPSFASDLISTTDPVSSCKLFAIVLLVLVYLATLLCLSRQAQNVKALNFRVPFVPLVPCLSIFLNTFLMINLESSTWVRFVVWMTIGLFIYFSYGISHSKLKVKKES